jgi:hypothetical protein
VLAYLRRRVVAKRRQLVQMCAFGTLAHEPDTDGNHRSRASQQVKADGFDFTIKARIEPRHKPAQLIAKRQEPRTFAEIAVRLVSHLIASRFDALQ